MQKYTHLRTGFHVLWSCWPLRKERKAWWTYSLLNQILFALNRVWGRGLKNRRGGTQRGRRVRSGAAQEERVGMDGFTCVWEVQQSWMLADEPTWRSVYLWFVILNHDIENEAKTPETMIFSISVCMRPVLITCGQTFHVCKTKIWTATLINLSVWKRQSVAFFLRVRWEDLCHSCLYTKTVRRQGEAMFLFLSWPRNDQPYSCFTLQEFLLIKPWFNPPMKSGLGDWSVLKFIPDCVLMWGLYWSSLKPCKLLTDSLGPPR